MNSLENLVLQWTNCLYDSTGDCIKSIEELQNGKVYYNLINDIKPWDCKTYGENHKDMVIQFLEEEYPNFILGKKSKKLENLCIALLVLARVSLEPVFHQSLCKNLHLDLQIKIKSILESIYPLGKNVTIEDICRIMSLSDKVNSKPFSAKPKWVLQEFLNSPVARSVHSDKKIYEQSKQIRHLRADIEIMQYEKSELIEDIKNQEKQIEELQHKLQDTLSELKILREENCKTNNLNLTCKAEDIKSEMKSFYEKELKSLESYIAELQNDNCQLQDEKSQLMDEIKACKAKYSIIEEKNINNEQIVDSLLLQIEKKDNELVELKIKYEELQDYLREKSRMYFNNHSFEADDRMISEISLNRSETLSSVIEIQLQDTRNELINAQDKFKNINILLTIIMEEYKKLKDKVKILSDNNIKTISVEEEKSVPIETQNELNVETISVQEQHDLIETSSVTTELTSDYNFVSKEIKQTFVNILKNDSGNNYNKSLFLDLLNKIETCRNVRRLKNNLKLLFNKEKNVSTNVTNLNTLNSLQKYQNNANSNNFEVRSTVLNSKEYFPIIHINYTFNNITHSLFIDKQTILNYVIFNTVLKNNVIKCLEDITSNNESDEVSTLSKSDLESLQSSWNSLYESICSELKIYKVLLLLKKIWIFVSQSLKVLTIHNFDAPEVKELYEKKDAIENEMKDIYFESLQILSLKFIDAVQFVTMISKDYNSKIASFYQKCVPTLPENLKNLFLPSSSTDLKEPDLKLQQKNYIINKIINIKRKINKFHYLTKLYEKKSIEVKEAIKVEVKEEIKIKEEEVSVTTPVVASQDKESKNDLNKLSDEDMTEQFQRHLREIHEKYELKLEKMKEKMKSAYNSQVTMMKKEQEIAATNKMQALQSKIEDLCYNHTEELKKYKKHISELTTQLWDVGEKLIIEKQKKEDFIQRLKALKLKQENSEPPSTKHTTHEVENYDYTSVKLSPDLDASSIASSSDKMHSVRGFQIMGNAFHTEDEEGEVFDTTYLTDMQRSRHSLSTVDINRLSILQMRNAKCKPHLKSSYPAEVQFSTVPLTEEDIKSGNTPDELFNDSLSQSLLTGKKVKRRDRTRNATETPRRTRRFSNIFRKPRLSMDRK